MELEQRIAAPKDSRQLIPVTGLFRAVEAQKSRQPSYFDSHFVLYSVYQVLITTAILGLGSVGLAAGLDYLKSMYP